MSWRELVLFAVGTLFGVMLGGLLFGDWNDGVTEVDDEEEDDA